MKQFEDKGSTAHPIRVGALYFAIVFAAGFVLGAIRVTFIVPATGELIATLLELPWMLCASWLACRWVVRHFKVSELTRPRLLMGASAFALLMVAEFTLSVFVFGDSPQEFFAKLSAAAGLVGLTGQLVFAFMPVLIRSHSR